MVAKRGAHSRMLRADRKLNRDTPKIMSRDAQTAQPFVGVFFNTVEAEPEILPITRTRRRDLHQVVFGGNVMNPTLGGGALVVM